ncbi:hypothetical protein GII36_00715 [Candidatus Mycosynbacter amalyticus]|uniref:Uncharacterized protein n=1 Tax=Candidatus Mycosynbacter amalyticus TaxID=2665156 RepID=A0A857MMJ1_9BACT|nr:hypothetical protein [Candidatus Mycosynbacter amalyticus]QHN42381.1 hypothetical protein GII36_00715 [Candidatus Mycosynbacter amalyticus]
MVQWYQNLDKTQKFKEQQMNDTGAKQQIVDTIQGADTILVTVSADPSVDELSAALGLTMYLNDMGKHATAVMSGALPPAITFLEPEKTFEPTVDSLRDFVIALDKEKADHLRYKVEGDVVKIFITPYKTVITDKDLQFTQGDYNVEMVIALGVTDQDHLDKALAAHGKIFHDASVATVGLSQSTLGTIDWTDESASSVSELTTSLIDGLKSEEHPVSSQVASSLLTGIVAATDRFSNDNTSARTMSLAGELMASGANQQLIASKLREGAKLPLQDDGRTKKIDKSTPEKSKPSDEQPKRRDGGLSIAHDAEQEDAPETPKPRAKSAPKKPMIEPLTAQPSDNPTEVLDHALKKAEADRSAAAEQQTDDLIASVTEEANAAKSVEDVLSEQLAAVAPPAAPIADELQQAAPDEPKLSPAKSLVDTPDTEEPSFGGTLNATAEAAAEDKRNADLNRNKTILSHESGQYVGDTQPTFESPLNAAGQTGEQPSIDPFAPVTTAPAAPIAPLNPLPPLEPIAPATPTGTLADIDQQNRATEAIVPDASSADAAQSALDAVIQAAPDPQPFNPLDVIETAAPAPAPQLDNTPTEGAPMTPPPPPMPDFAQLPPLPPPVFPASSGVDIPETPSAPALPPLEPQAPELPQAPLPPEQLGSVLPEAPSLPPAQDAGPTDPKQFRIPGQQ